MLRTQTRNQESTNDACLPTHICALNTDALLSQSTFGCDDEKQEDKGR